MFYEIDIVNCGHTQELSSSWSQVPCGPRRHVVSAVNQIRRGCGGAQRKGEKKMIRPMPGICIDSVNIREHSMGERF